MLAVPETFRVYLWRILVRTFAHREHDEKGTP